MFRRMKWREARVLWGWVGAGCLLYASGLGAQEATIESSPVTAAERRAVVERISELMTERYVFPEVAERCADTLRSGLEAGRFDASEEAGTFAEALTEALREVTRDKHIRVRVRQPERAELERVDPLRARAEQRAREEENNFGFEKVERLEGNVGLLDLRYFSGSPDARPTAAAAMGFLANSYALIVDVRQNGGGDPDMVRFITSYLFDRPTHLNSLYWRQGDRTDEFWTLEEVPGRRLASGVPIFVLTAERTFSGAEEFSYNLRTRERAKLIGEVTGGGANPGGTVPIDERFGIFIPTGRAINPITGTNWEGVGVEPHLSVPAAEAFDVAYEKAKDAAEAFRNERKRARAEHWAALDRGQKRAEQALEDGDEAGAAAALREALDAGLREGLLGEGELNQLGYDYLGQEQVALAIATLELNVARFPESSNVYDSLGEAYKEAGRKQEAIESYRKSLALDPENTNAVAMLETLQ